MKQLLKLRVFLLLLYETQVRACQLFQKPLYKEHLLNCTFNPINSIYKVECAEGITIFRLYKG